MAQPDPHAKPSASAPGSDDAERERIEASRSKPEEAFKDVLDADPEVGGSKSTPDDAPAARQPGPQPKHDQAAGSSST